MLCGRDSLACEHRFQEQSSPCRSGNSVVGCVRILRRILSAVLNSPAESVGEFQMVSASSPLDDFRQSQEVGFEKSGFFVASVSLLAESLQGSAKRYCGEARRCAISRADDIRHRLIIS